MGVRYFYALQQLDSWLHRLHKRHLVPDVGQCITDEINADPAEVAKLQRARQQARTGRTRPLRQAMTDFYEEDEPVEDVLAAFERGEKHLTGPPKGNDE